MEWFVKACEQLKRRWAPIHYDATYHRAEQYYTSVYLSQMKAVLPQPHERPIAMLDAGCGTGRFLVPMAQRGYQMTAIDFHKDSLRIAVQNLRAADCEADVIDGELTATLAAMENARFDAAMCLEVLHVHPDRTGVTAELCRVLRPGGWLFMTHRPRFYILLKCLMRRHLDDALLVAQQSEGRLLKKYHRIYYNWQTHEEIDRLYAGLGMHVHGMSPIGPFSGCESDPLATVCDPSRLDASEQALLRQVEDAYDRETLMASRYVLVAAQKPSN